MNFKKNFLLFVVFITGASVLVVEIVATRVLAPYFGNTIFSISSIISTILAALSFGYYFGGKLADKKPSFNLFFFIILMSGICVLLIQFLNVFLLPLLGISLSMTIGPLISAIILFFIPAFLMGMLSPFAIKLQKKINPETGIGTMAGKIFFWSTFGSIFGSLFSGFYLIPNFGLSNILIGTGLVLVLLAGVFLIVLNKTNRLISILFLLIIILAGLQLPKERFSAIYAQDGMYQKIIIIQAQDKDGHELRILKQDTNPSGWKYLNPEYEIVDYIKFYKALNLIENPKETLMIGVGAYLMPDLIIEEMEGVNIDVAEIEPSLYDLAIEYFDLNKSDRLKNYIVDGRRFLKDTDKIYDLIFIDAYSSPLTIPTHLITKEFFELSNSKLNTNGILLANVVGKIDSLAVSSIVKTFKLSFPNSYFFATEDPEGDAMQNIVFLGIKSDKKIDFTNLEIIQKFYPLIENVNEMLINEEQFNNGIILTDNYCPIDYLMHKSFLDRK